MKKSSTHSKQKKSLEELANKRLDEIQYLSKQIDFNNLTYYFKVKNALKTFICFKGPLGFYRRRLYKTKNSRGKTKKFKSDINKIVKGGKKLEEQKSAIKNTKTIYQVVWRLF